jgi:hypothetical protein
MRAGACGANDWLFGPDKAATCITFEFQICGVAMEKGGEMNRAKVGHKQRMLSISVIREIRGYSIEWCYNRT